MNPSTSLPRRIFLVAGCLSAMLMINATLAVSLEELQWERRVIVAYGEDGDVQVERFLELAREQTCELKERDVDAYLVTAQGIDAVTAEAAALDEQSTDFLRAQRHPSDTEFALVLIGKDGGVKGRADSADELLAFLLLIDSMPMRQREIEERGENC